jgi:hypothetical protein
VAQRIHGPGYISLETALSHHAWIPEAVYAVTSASLDRSNEFDTPPGHFSFTRVPQETLYAEVSRVEKEDGDSFLLASPLKALADYVYVHKCDWNRSIPAQHIAPTDGTAICGRVGECRFSVKSPRSQTRGGVIAPEAPVHAPLPETHIDPGPRLAVWRDARLRTERKTAIVESRLSPSPSGKDIR